MKSRDFVQRGSNRYGDLVGWKSGTASQSVNVDDIPVMGPAARSMRGPNVFERMFSALKNSWDLWTKVENIESVAKSGNVIPGTIETQNVEPVMVDMSLYNYTSTEPVGVSLSVPQAGKPRDTSVIKGNESVINLLNTKDSLRAAKESRAKNIEHTRKLGY